MAYDQETGTTGLRAEFVDGMVKGFAERQYKFKQALTIESTSAWKNSYFRESSTPLTAAGGLSIKGVPRLANFPQASAKWEEKSAYIEKFAAEGIIAWEDILTDDISVQTRTLYRIAESVTNAVDAAIWAVLSDGYSSTATFTASNIQSVAIASTKHWTGSSAAIVDNILNALQLIAQSNYDTTNCMMFVSPRDRRAIMKWLSDKGSQFPMISENIVNNGYIGTLCGVRIVVSNNVSNSAALVCVPKICGTWKEAVAFKTTTIEDPYIKLTVRAVEEGVTMLTDPQAVVLISNTQGDNT